MAEELITKEEQLKQLFEEAISGGKMNCFETAQGVIYFEPKGEKLIFGGVTNTGIIPQYEFDYDFEQSFDWNLQGMAEQIMEEEGYPEEDLDEDVNTLCDKIDKVDNDLKTIIDKIKPQKLPTKESVETTLNNLKNTIKEALGE